MLCRWVHEIDGNGDPSLSTLGKKIIRLQSETVDAAEAGLETVSDGNWPDDSGCLLYARRRDLWISTHRNYFDSLQTMQLPGGQANAQHAIGATIKETVHQFKNPYGGKRELPRC